MKKKKKSETGRATKRPSTNTRRERTQQKHKFTIQAESLSCKENSSGLG